jgi:hypothetical protein
MTSHKIALLIPCTSKGRDNWKTMKDVYLNNLSVKHFLLTQDKEHEYVFYIGYDSDDRIFADVTQQEVLKRYSLVFKNVSFVFIKFENIAKGHVTKMWNVLFKQSYEDNCDYFYQCGDDIVFHTKGWVNDCISKLKTNDNIGLSGPINNNNLILTQAFVSREHMEIFGWFFPEEIINWGCDDWYNHLYSPTMFFPLSNHYCSNEGGAPRYIINNDPLYGLNANYNTRLIRTNARNLALKHKTLIENYLKNKTYVFVN